MIKNIQKLPAVTVIVPNYNNAAYLRDCLGSVLNQSFKNWECIVINDGSTDGSLSIIKEFAEKDSRFILIDQPNRGVCASRNTGMDMARGNYITFLDADDCYTQWALEVMYQTAVKYDADLVGGGMIPVAEDFEFNVIKPKLLKRKPRTKKAVFMTGSGINDFQKTFTMGETYKWVWIWRQLFRKDLVQNKRFVEELYIGDDLCFMVDVAPDIKKFAMISFFVTYHRLSSTSVMNAGNWGPRKFKHFPKELSHVYESVTKKYPKNIIDKLYKGLVRYLYEEILLNAMKYKKFQSEAAAVLRQFYGTKYMPKRYFSFFQRVMVWIFLRAY